MSSLIQQNDPKTGIPYGPASRKSGHKKSSLKVSKYQEMNEAGIRRTMRNAYLPSRNGHSATKKYIHVPVLPAKKCLSLLLSPGATHMSLIEIDDSWPLHLEIGN